jgi:hypothetical protein
VEVAKRGTSAVTVCSSAFLTLGRAQARALGDANLPIAVIPHPFGGRSREEVREIASRCVDELVDLMTGAAK